MAIEDIWFNVNYKLPPKIDEYWAKDYFGNVFKCIFVKGEWRQEIFIHYDVIIRKDIVAWKYIDYE